jgi:EmrB/QacA subfamily drug resistance transporter
VATGTEPQSTITANKWWAMLGVGLGVLMGTLDAGIVNISLPTLIEAFDSDFATIQWVVLSYLLVITSLMLMVARLGDMRGKKQVYIVGLVLFTIGSLLCGFSPDVGWLIAFRALQGTGAVMTTALGTAIITEVFPTSERGRALGIIGSIVSVGIASGPVLGGILIGLAGWRSVFLVNVPIGIIAFLVVRRFVPELPPGRPGQRFDIPGALILLVVLAGYALGMTLGQDRSFSDGTVQALLLMSGIGLVAFVILEARVSQPLIELRLFRNILFSINLLMGLLVFIVMAGQFIMPFFLELVQHYRTEETGVLLMTIPVAMGLVSPISGVLSDRFGSRGISLIGLLMVVVGCLTISSLHADVTPLGFVLRLTPFGLGFGLFQSPNNSAIMGAVPRERLGVASGLLALSRTMGQSTGLPLIGVLFTAQVLAAGNLQPGADITQAPAAALVVGTTETYRIAAYIILASTILAAVALWIDYRQQKSGAAAEHIQETAAP